MELKSAGFKSFLCKENQTLGVSFASATRILKLAGNDDSVTLSSDGKGERLFFSFERKQGGGKSCYELKLLNIDCEVMTVPDIDPDAVITIASQEWSRIIRDLIAVGESVTISVSSGRATFSTEGSEINGVIDIVNNRDTKIKCETPIKQTFALRYLGNFCKASTLSTVTTVRLYENAPFDIEYPLDDLGFIKFYLAPKITEE
jgi:proliferating cell nuclear antigen